MRSAHARPTLVTSRGSDNVWAKVVARLLDSGALKKHEYFDFFAGTELAADSGGVIVVATDCKEQISVLRNHFKTKIEQALRDIGRSESVVKFRVISSAPKHKSFDGEEALQPLSAFRSKPVEWQWTGRIAAGKLTLMIGDPGLGKSWIAAQAAACVSAGNRWPDRTGSIRGSVLLLDAENGVEDTLRPRVDLLHGDPTRIFLLPRTVGVDDEMRGISLRDIGPLRTWIERYRARLLVIDPVSAYLGSADSHRDTEVRAVLSHLQHLAEVTNCALLGVMHRAKGAPRDAVLSAIGSVAFAAAARVVLLVARDPESAGRRIFGPVKTNLSAAPPALAYRLSSDTGLRWERAPLVAFDPEKLLTSDTCDDRSERKDAEDIIRGLLRSGGRSIDAKTAMSEAEACKVSPKQMRRALERLGLRSQRVGGFAGLGKWVFMPTSAKKRES